MATLAIHLVSVLALACLVEGVCRLGRIRPALCHALWLVVLIKLVVPPVMTWPGGEIAFTTTLPDHNAPGEVTEVPTRNVVGQLSLSDTSSAASPVPPVPAATTTTPPTIPGNTIRNVALTLWGFGALFVSLQLLRRARAARRIVQSGIPAPEWLQHKLDATCHTLGVAKINARVVNTGCGSVYIHFLGRPTLVVSDTALAHIEADRWAPILTHEMAHLKRRDHWVAWLILAAGALWWWNPCLFWVRNRMHHFSELACDAWVVERFPEERKRYAESMLRILTLLSEQRSPALTLGLAVWSPAAQERRLWMIMKGTGACKMPGVYAAGIVALSVMVTPAWITMAENVNAAPETVVETNDGDGNYKGWTLDLTPSEMTRNTLNSLTNVDFEDLHIKYITAFIHDVHGVSILIDSRVIKPLLSDGSSLPLIPAETAPHVQRDYDSDGHVSAVNMKNTTIDKALTNLTSSLGLTFELRGRVVWLTTPTQMKKDALIPLPAGPATTQSLVDALESKSSVEFENIHIEDVLEFLRKNFEIDIVLDPRVLAPMPSNGATTPDPTPGQVTYGVIPYINVANVSTGELLYHLTRMLNLSYRVEADRIYISTPVGVMPGKPVYEPDAEQT